MLIANIKINDKDFEVEMETDKLVSFLIKELRLISPDIEILGTKLWLNKYLQHKQEKRSDGYLYDVYEGIVNNKNVIVEFVDFDNNQNNLTIGF